MRWTPQYPSISLFYACFSDGWVSCDRFLFDSLLAQELQLLQSCCLLPWGCYIALGCFFYHDSFSSIVAFTARTAFQWYFMSCRPICIDVGLHFVAFVEVFDGLGLFLIEHDMVHRLNIITTSVWCRNKIEYISIKSIAWRKHINRFVEIDIC